MTDAQKKGKQNLLKAHKPRTELTIKERKLVQALVANGGNKAAAAREALNVRSKDPNRHTRAANNHLAKPVVQEELNRVLLEHGMTQDFGVRKLMSAVDTGWGIDAKHKDALHALELLLKITNVIQDKKSAHVRVNINAKADELPYDQLVGEYKRSQSVMDNLIADGEIVA